MDSYILTQEGECSKEAYLCSCSATIKAFAFSDRGLMVHVKGAG